MSFDRAWGVEERLARPAVSSGKAGATPPSPALQSLKAVEDYDPAPYRSSLAPYRVRAAHAGMRALSSMSYHDPRGIDVATAVEDAQRNRVLARDGKGQVERVRFARAVGDAVFWEARAPPAAVNAHVGAPNHAARVLDGEAHAHAPVPGDLRLARGAHDRRRAVHVNRLAHALARERLAEGVFGRVRGDDL